MNAEEIPQELINILDKHAGRKHSREGSVVLALGEILTKFMEMSPAMMLNPPEFKEANELAIGSRWFFIDIETFGLNVLDDPPIEIGFKVTDHNLNEIDFFHTLIWDNMYDLFREEHEEANDIIWKMHSESGLWEEAKAGGVSEDEAYSKMDQWLDSLKTDPKNDYLVGSSVHFDRYILFFTCQPILNKFHHRMVDVSSLKVLTERYWPSIAQNLKNTIKPQKKHRVMPDIEDTIQEFRFYLSNVLPEAE